ncbi:MAG TPA: MarR family winged helix-turn-helix transcriptional regulator, partial [Ilumatobacter sp.]|nr:MarR family winged helix-turn-helix transcriptional regulator [Ilumatobacter sp.]
AKLLELIPDGGCSQSDLARDAGITKQAVGPRLAEMAGLDYITVSADPGDGRAQIVEITDQGRHARDVARELTAVMEAEWEAVVGEADYAVFRSVLDRLADRPRSTVSPAPT